jgi:hypothetical protein
MKRSRRKHRRDIKGSFPYDGRGVLVFLFFFFLLVVFIVMMARKRDRDRCVHLGRWSLCDLDGSGEILMCGEGRVGEAEEGLFFFPRFFDGLDGIGGGEFSFCGGGIRRAFFVEIAFFKREGDGISHGRLPCG